MASSYKKGFVYLLGDWLKEGYYKIGVTRGSIERRIKKLQTGNAGEIYMCRYYETEIPFFIEKWLHFKLFGEKIKNEWFELTEQQVFDFQKECKKIEEIYKEMEKNPFFKGKKLNFQ